MKSKSIKGKSPEEVQSELDKCLQDGFKPTLAVVFLSITQNHISVCNILEKYRIAVFGATTNGEFIDDETEQGSIAILLLDINPEYFFIQFSELDGENDRKITQVMGKEALKKFNRPAFLIAGSNLLTDAEQLLLGIADTVGKDVNVFGGMAGDDFTFTKPVVFSKGKSSERGIVSIVFDEEKINIKGRATCGWKSIGTEKTVTKSEGNRLYTIEGVPALDISAKYSGIKDLDRGNDDFFNKMSTLFPLQLQRESGNPVMRPGIVVNWDDHSFICSGHIPQGSKIKFCLPPDFDVIETVIHECEKLKETEIPEADAIIMFNCAGRIMSLGPMINKEIEGIQKIWKAPMVGFFTYAELARATGGNLEMHNLTNCCVALKEKVQTT